MALDYKPPILCATEIDRVDRGSYSATASVNFKTIDCLLENKGSEFYDYEGLLVLQGTGTIQMVLNNLVSYSQDYMQGRSATPSATPTTTVTSIPVLRCDNATYTSIVKVKITGYVGNKRHIEVFSGGHDGATFVRVGSYYTADTTTEISSISFFSTTTQTVVLSSIFTANPKLQYNPHAILLDTFPMTNQTAGIIYGGVNDTRGVDDLNGGVYYYVVVTSGVGGGLITTHINEDVTSDRPYQRLVNSNGSVQSLNSSLKNDSYNLENCSSFISSDTGRNKISINIGNRLVNLQQFEYYYTNPDTSTPMTSLLLLPSASVSGNVQLYAIKKGYNADLTAWKFRQIHPVSNASFAGGKSFEIMPDAMFARINIKGYSLNGSNINIDFDTTTPVSKQYLKGSTTSTTALFATNRTIGRIEKVSEIELLVALKTGANRPIIGKAYYNENTIDINGLWGLDSTTVYNNIILSADNTNLMDAEISVSFI